jgi:threonine dehydrogenase-like Zn-dependent dehydrogenase
MQGKAALYRGLDRGFTVEELPTPEVEPGGVLVRVTAGAICGSDLHYWRGDSKFPEDRLPRITGHEFCGYVHTLGEGVTTDSLRRPLHEGDRVAFPFIFPCMRCYHCIRGELHVCPYRMRRNIRYTFDEYPYCDGGFAEYFYLQPGHFVFKVPDELPDDAVAPVNCAMAQVTFAVNKAGIRTGDNVVIQGAGGLGVYAAAIARDLGAGKVISIDGQSSRLDFVKRCGATHTININDVKTPAQRNEAVRDLTEGIGADLVVEVVGMPGVVEEGLTMLRRGGTYVTIGSIATDEIRLALSKFINDQHHLMGVTHYNPWVIPAALDFLVNTKDKYDLLSMVSNKFPIENINEAFEAAEWSGKSSGFNVTRAIVNP